jgi:hypothetical protein
MQQGRSWHQRQAGRTAAITEPAARAMIEALCSRDARVSMDCSMPSVSTAAMTKAKGRAVVSATGEALWKLVFMVISVGAVGGVCGTDGRTVEIAEGHRERFVTNCVMRALKCGYGGRIRMMLWTLAHAQCHQPQALAPSRGQDPMATNQRNIRISLAYRSLVNRPEHRRDLLVSCGDDLMKTTTCSSSFVV